MTDNDRGKKKIHRGVYPRKIASFLVGNYNRLALVSLAFLYYCCCFLLLSSSVDCFTCLSPFIVRKTIQIHPHIELLKQQRNDCYHCPSRTFLPSSKTTKEQDHGDDSTTSDINNNVETLVTWFIKNLWRGVTIPFPQLKVVVQSHGTKKSGLAIGLGLRKGVLFLFSYLSVGVIAYSYIFEKWSIVDSLYFTTVCFTTVGYGDLVPTSPAGKIFTCFFGIAGITFLGAAVATICSSVVQAEVEAAKKVERVSKRRILNIFGGMPDKLKYFKKSSSKSQKELLEKVEKQKQRKAKLASYGAERAVKVMNTKLLKSYLPSLSVILGGGAIMGKLNHGWSLIDSIYYSIITASSIGLGDFAAQTSAARIFAILFIPLSVGATGELLSSVANALANRRQKNAYKTQYENNLTLAHLKAMDTNSNGEVDREEYVYFMLKEMGLVDQAELNELFEQFKHLDVTNSGVIDIEDLKLMAKLRGVDWVE